MKRIIKKFSFLTILVAMVAVFSVTAYADEPINFDMSLVLASETQLDVYVDGQWNAKLSESYGFGDTATIEADEKSGNKVFSHWTANGSIISYSRKLKLTMNAHTTLYAVYANTAPTERPVAGFTSITRTNDGKSISFQAIASPKNDDTITSAGIVYSTSATGDALTIGGTDVENVEAVNSSTLTNSLPKSVLDKNKCWMLQITPDSASANTVYHAKAYVTVGGTPIYGDEKNVKLSALKSGVTSVANLDGFESDIDDDLDKVKDELKNSQSSSGHSVNYTIAEKSGITYHVYADHAEVAEVSTNLITAGIVSEIEGQAVTTISENAFNSCKQLTEVKIPDSVTEIDANAFWGCTSLESLTIPKTVTTIDKNAFSHCTAFKTIYGYTGSAAETFAKTNNIEFVALDAQSEETLGIAKAPTVDEQGVVSWSPVENAVKYRIVKEYGGKTYFGKETTETSYQQNNTNVLDKHKIYIRSYDADGNYTNGEVLTVPAKVGIAKAPTVDSDGVVTWKPVQNAVTYKIVKEYNGKTFTGKETMELNYQQNNVPIVEYKVYIRAFGGDGSYTNGEVLTVPEKAKRLGTAKAPTVDSDGVVSWKAVTNASKYVVVKVVDGEKYYGKSTTETSYKFANKPRKDYRVYVLTYDEMGNYTVGQEAEVELPLGYVDDVTVDAKGNVTWTAARNAVKYKVGKTVNGKTYYTGELTTNSATIKVPKSDYKVFVVAFDKDGNRTWGKKLDIKA